ncbi:MAG: 3-dehydroquinate synthase family protein [Actinomycetota bacterium]
MTGSSTVSASGSGPTTITVDLGERSYPVLVGHGARSELAAVIPEGVKRVAIVTQAGIPCEIDPGVPSIRIEVPPGEAAKTMGVVEDICRRLAQEGFTRADAIVAVGGGVVTDLGGFAAAVYHRGIRFVSVSTTLLGMVDAAIGGKTGVNLPEGKNLVGAFWQPSAVICDTETLQTLPHREFQSGVGEIAKYHFLGGGQLDQLPIDERVAACVRIKADVVMADEREGGRRAILNYGHTLAHAIETAGAYDLRHGECVAIGIAYVAEVARRLGRIDDDRVAEHQRVLAAYELPTKVPDQLTDDELIALFSRDKKAVDGVTFVLDGPAGVETVVGVDPDVLAASFEAVR